MLGKKKKKRKRKRKIKNYLREQYHSPVQNIAVDPELREGAARLWVTGGKTVGKARGMWEIKGNDRIRYDACFTYLLVKKTYFKYYQLDLSYKCAHSLTVSS